MSATFSPDLSDPVSQVRQKIGDTDIADVELQDETISYYLDSVNLTPLRAAAQLAYDLSAKYAKAATFTVDDQRNDNSKIAANYRTLGDTLTNQANLAEGLASAGASGFGAVMVTGIGDCRGPLNGPCCGPIHDPYW